LEIKTSNPRSSNKILILAIAGFSFLFIGRIISGTYIEILWFDSIGFLSVFWKRVIWEWGIRIIAMVLSAFIVFINLRIVAKTLDKLRIKRRVGDLVISEQIPNAYILRGIVLASILVGFWVGIYIPPTMGLEILFLIKKSAWGITDPILGKDLSFYVISLPVIKTIVTLSVIVLLVVFGLILAGYTATGSLQWKPNRIEIKNQARKHLGAIVAIFFLVLAIRFWIGQSLLLLNGTSDVQGIFGYTDAESRLTVIRTLAVLSIFASIGAIWGTLKSRIFPVLTTVGILIFGGLVLGQVYPSIVQRFQVEPNELERETPFIENNIEFTRIGFGLDKLDRREFEYTKDIEVDWREAALQFDGLPVWSSHALLTIFRELEARFPYYDFSDVTVDRYDTGEGAIPVALSVRQVFPRGIQDPNWQNLHLRNLYIRGMGAVASAAGYRTPEGRPPMFLSGIPPEFNDNGIAPKELQLTQPEIYVGTRKQNFAIIDPDQDLAIPGVHFPRGIEINSLLKKISLAWQANDTNLLFASEVTKTSRFLLRRNVLDRVIRVSGSLIDYWDNPYPVISEGRIVWILEGITSTRWFPLSTTHDLGRMGFSPVRRSSIRYARNSVKVTVDGVTGDINFYVVDDQDQLLQVYQKAFPELFTSIAEMPEDLHRHIRYSRTMLDLQARVLSRYHQGSAPVFHSQQDVWEIPQELAQGITPVPYQAEYGIYRLPGEAEDAFLLTSVFVPRGRQNLTAILIAQNDPGNYGDLVLFDVPIEDQVPGPRQVEALVEQDPEISQQFSLWRTGGSQVWTGHLHIVPVGQTILYMEPVFLAAEEDAIPELRRFVVSDGRRVAMEETLIQSINTLASMAGDDPSVTELIPTNSDLIDLTREGWPEEALIILNDAETSLRNGNFQEFGIALDELRAFLRNLSQKNKD
tara:strand:+ start:4144 stop:6906 length:2763 start_codon:yes stop_codon:yes gene_type:complete